MANIKKIKLSDNSIVDINVPYSLTVGTKSFDGSRAINVTAADLGLSGAMLFLGTTTTSIKDGNTTKTIKINSKDVTVTNGNVVLYGNKEYVWNGSSWEELGNEGDYKVKQNAVGDPAASNNTSDTFISNITQNANGDITPVKKYLPNYAGSSSRGGAATSAEKVNKSLVVKLNSGTKEGTNLFTFNGSAEKTVNVTPAAIGAVPLNGISTIVASASDTAIYLQSQTLASYLGFKDNSGATLGYYGVNAAKEPVYYNNKDNKILHASNYSSYAVPLTGATMNGTLTFNGGNAAGASKIALDPTKKGQITDNSTATIFGFTSSTALTVGHSSYNLSLRSKNRPTVNGTSSIAYTTDIPTELPNPKNFILKINNGTTEGTNLFTYKGSTEKTINLTPSLLGVYSKTQIDEKINGTANRITKFTSTNAVGNSNIVDDGSVVTVGSRLVVKGNGGSYNEGIRVLPASNGWSNVYFCSKSSLSTGNASDDTIQGTEGGWLLGRRGAVGSANGAIGDFTIEYNNSIGSGLTLHQDGSASFHGNSINVSDKHLSMQYDSSNGCLNFIFT